MNLVRCNVDPQTTQGHQLYHPGSITGPPLGRTHPDHPGDILGVQVIPLKKRKTKGPGLLGLIPEPGPWREPEGESLVEEASAHVACPGGLIPGC